MSAHDKLLQEIRARKFHPIYFLQGEEPYFIDLLTNALEEHVLAPDERSFNQTTLYGRDASLIDIIGACKRYPVMADYQLILVKEAQDLSDLNRENTAKLLEGYAKNPVPSTVLVFGYKYKKLDARKSLSKALKDAKALHDFDGIGDWDVAKWVTQYLKDQNLQYEPQVPDLIAQHIGNDLQRIANELSKLELRLGADRKVTAELVFQNIGISKDYNIFELQRAFTAGDPALALTILKYFASHEKDHPPIPLVVQLYNYFLNLLLAHTSADKSDTALLAIFKTNPYFLKQFRAAMQRFNTARLVHILKRLGEMDASLKGASPSQPGTYQLYQDLVVSVFY